MDTALASTVVDTISAGVVVHDADTGTIRDVNDAFAEMHGYDRDELVGHAIEIVSADTPEYSLDQATGRIQKARDEGSIRFEWRNKRADGTTFPVEVSLTPLSLDEGEYVIATVRAISDRKAYERELEQSEAKYRSLFEDARDAIMLLDDEGFFDCNEMTLELFGFDSVEAFSQQAPWELSPETQPDGTNSREGAQKHIRAAFEEGEAFYEWVHVRDDGTEFPAEVKLSRFQLDGEPVLRALVRDITERKEYERELEEQRDTLEILNQVLRHDIRNDLQLVTAYAELLVDTCETDEAKDQITTIAESAEHAVELTETARDIADVLLSESVEPRQINLEHVLETEVSEVRSSYPDSVITYETPIPSVRVTANKMLSSVFSNLLKNAIQHNDKDVAEVTISATERDETVRVRITDNGPGVPDTQKEAIFGKNEKGLDSAGAGMGLYLVDTLVTNYNGEVWVEDHEPDGSVFVVELPITE